MKRLFRFDKTNGRPIQGRATLPSNDIARLRVLLAETSERYLEEQLAVARATLARALAGMTMRRGTVALIRQGMDRLDAERKARAL